MIAPSTAPTCVATTCEVIDEGGVDDVLARLGPPLRRGADPRCMNRISKSQLIVRC